MKNINIQKEIPSTIDNSHFPVQDAMTQQAQKSH